MCAGKIFQESGFINEFRFRVGPPTRKISSMKESPPRYRLMPISAWKSRAC